MQNPRPWWAQRRMFATLVCLPNSSAQNPRKPGDVDRLSQSRSFGVLTTLESKTAAYGVVRRARSTKREIARQKASGECEPREGQA